MASVLAACGIPVDDEPVPVALPSDFDLEPTTTTTTTIPEEIAANQRIIYLIRDGRLVPRLREIPEPITIDEVIAALLVGPTESELAQGDETRVPSDMDIGVTVSNEVLVLDIRGEFTEETPFLRFEGEARTQLIGQLVLTGLRANPDLAGVNFQENGLWRAVSNGAGELQELDADGVPIPLTTEDFATLRVGGI
ncbi:MAG: GerMN domain-containing protein [Acidimicrobiales bacterium]